MNAIQTVQDQNLRAILSEVLDEVKKCSLSEEDRKEILDQISEAAKNPTKSTLEELVGTLKNITAVGQFAIVVGKITSWITGNPL